METTEKHTSLSIVEDVVHQFDGAGISSIGAKAALSAMARHWESHLSEGHSPSIIISDIDDLKDRLGLMQAEIQSRISGPGENSKKTDLDEVKQGWNALVEAGWVAVGEWKLYTVKQAIGPSSCVRILNADGK